MRILIKDPPGKLTATFETKGPPCPGCAFRQSPRDPGEVEACMMVNRSISGAILKECSDKKWYQPARTGPLCSNPECVASATWVRRTQFSGDHAFCDEHAKTEADFGQQDASYFFWEQIKC